MLSENLGFRILRGNMVLTKTHIVIRFFRFFLLFFFLLFCKYKILRESALFLSPFNPFPQNPEFYHQEEGKNIVVGGGGKGGRKGESAGKNSILSFYHGFIPLKEMSSILTLHQTTKL